MTTHMTSKARFMAALRGRPVDRPPAAGIVSVISEELMDLVGIRLPEANTQPQAMAELAAATHDVLGFDNVMPIFSIAQEATALGCEVDFSDPTRLPTPVTHPWADRDIEIRLPDGFPEAFLEDQHVQCALAAIRQLKERFGDEVAVLGKVMGPWTLSYHVYNVEEFLFDTLENPSRVRLSLETLKSVPVIFAEAQLRAGADAIVWADHATGTLISPLMYRDFLLPLHKELIPQVAAPVILHCCGPTQDRIKYFREVGFAAFHFESQVAPEVAVAEAAGKMRLAGNINNPEVLLSASPPEVRSAAQHAIDARIDIIAPECAIPLETRLENLKEIVRTCEDNRRSVQ